MSLKPFINNILDYVVIVPANVCKAFRDYIENFRTNGMKSRLMATRVAQKYIIKAARNRRDASAMHVKYHVQNWAAVFKYNGYRTSDIDMFKSLYRMGLYKVFRRNYVSPKLMIDAVFDGETHAIQTLYNETKHRYAGKMLATYNAALLITSVSQSAELYSEDLSFAAKVVHAVPHLIMPLALCAYDDVFKSEYYVVLPLKLLIIAYRLAGVQLDALLGYAAAYLGNGTLAHAKFEMYAAIVYQEYWYIYAQYDPHVIPVLRLTQYLRGERVVDVGLWTWLINTHAVVNYNYVDFDDEVSNCVAYFVERGMFDLVWKWYSNWDHNYRVHVLRTLYGTPTRDILGSDANPHVELREAWIAVSKNRWLEPGALDAATNDDAEDMWSVGTDEDMSKVYDDRSDEEMNDYL